MSKILNINEKWKKIVNLVEKNNFSWKIKKTVQFIIFYDDCSKMGYINNFGQKI